MIENIRSNLVYAYLRDRDVDTGDIITYYSMPKSEEQIGIVVRSASFGAYDIMPFGRCYFEDIEKVMPTNVFRLDSKSLLNKHKASLKRLNLLPGKKALRRVK